MENGLVHSSVATALENPSIQQAVATIQESGPWVWTIRAIENKNLWYLIGGVFVGAYFGFRVGVVSGRARSLVENLAWMKAVAINSYDGVESISVQNIEVPRVVKETDVLIEVKAASIDPIDIKVSQGYGRGLRELVNKYNPNTTNSTFPVVLGRDGTGVISEVGSGVHNLRVGDSVWFIVPPCFQGSLSNYIILSSEYIRPLPESLTFESGATLPYTGLVAWNILVVSGDLGPSNKSKGKKVFIWGGVRAVERLCIQLCKVWGCEVTCLAPVYTHDYLRSLGASSVLKDDVQEFKNLLKQGSRFDVVVNTAGILGEDLCLGLLAPEGRVVTTLISTPGLREYGLFTSILARVMNSVLDLFKRNLLGETRRWIETRFTGEVLDYLATLVNIGAIDPVGERIFSVDQVELAFKYLAGGGHKGKLVIRMDQENSIIPWR